MPAFEHILVIKLGALGDFIQALGPMAAIRRHHPNAHITLLTTNPFKDFAGECGYFDQVYIDKKPKFIDLTGWLSLRKRLNATPFTRIYDLQNNDRTNLYFKLFSAKKKPEWVGTAKGASHRNTSPQRTKTNAFNGHIQTLAQIGIQDIETDPLEWMNADIFSFTLKSPYVLLIPGCAPNRPEKRWPAQKYGELANILHSMNIQPLIIGAAPEQEAAQIITAACPTAYDLTTQTSFNQIATLARGAIGAIGNDTGPMHIIGATNCPTLTLFSNASNPTKHAPMGDNITIIQKENLKNLTAQTVTNSFKSIITKKT